MNVRCDELAKAFRSSIQQAHPRTEPHDFEGWSLSHAGYLVNSFDYDKLYDWVFGHEVASHWSQRHQLSKDAWDQIYWDGISKAYKSLPRHLSQWFTKHIAGFSPTAKVEHRRNHWESNLCPRCRLEVETEEHILTCQHPHSHQSQVTHRQAMVQALEKKGTAPDIVALCQAIFRFYPLVPPSHQLPPKQQDLLRAQLPIGLSNWFRGRVAKLWVDHQHQWLLAQATRWKRSTPKWGSFFIQQILTYSWNLWRDRTDFVHDPQATFQQNKHKNIIEQITQHTNNLHLYLKSDRRRVRRLADKAVQGTVQEAQQALESIQAAQQRAVRRRNSMTAARQALRSWLRIPSS